MRKLSFVATVTVTDNKGNTVKDSNGHPVVISDPDFLLERTYENGICGSRTGYEQIRFTEALREAIKSQAKDAEKRGYWELEDAHFEAFKAHLASAPLVQLSLHVVAPFVTRFFLE